MTKINLDYGDDEGSKLADRANLLQDDVSKNDVNFAVSLFTATPGGCCSNIQGIFIDKRIRAYFWSASSYGENEALKRYILCYNLNIYRLYDEKGKGHSVCLVKN